LIGCDFDDALELAAGGENASAAMHTNSPRANPECGLH
jgi:hypothetical protein